MKDFFEWRDGWSLGIEAIDRQHRQLAEMLNTIVQLYLDNGGQTDSEQRSNQMHEQLKIFHEKVREHFSDEEALMLKANYPGHGEHAREHLMLLAELKHYIRHIEEGLDNIDIGTMDSLKIWLVAHITDSDKVFADFLQAHPNDEITSAHSVDS